MPVNKNGTLRKHVRGLMTWLPKFGPICTPEPTGANRRKPEPAGEKRITRGKTVEIRSKPSKSAAKPSKLKAKPRKGIWAGGSVPVRVQVRVLVFVLLTERERM